ncbi:hypothetical protein ABPG75_002203 [Micractinium tetrahymenae]
MHTSCRAGALASGPLSPCCRAGLYPLRRLHPSSGGVYRETRWQDRRQRRRRASPAQALLLEQAGGLASGWVDAVVTAFQLGPAMSGGPSSSSGGDPAAIAGLLALADLATALQPACFDADCERQKDMLLVASLAFPLLVLAAAVAYLLRPPPQSSLDEGSLFEDESTGTIFEAPEGAAPERDRKGELAFRPISYTPWPVEEGVEGERIRIDVGAVGERAPRTFVFSKALPQPSQLVVATLERPLGIVFEEDKRRKRAVVAGFAPAGHAEQLAKRAALNPALAATAPREGDVLRACTATNIVYQPAALAFGAQKPKRAIVVFGADGQGWPQTIAALQKGLVADGPVTLVLERRLQGDAAAAAAAGGAAATTGAGRQAGAAAAGEQDV